MARSLVFEMGRRGFPGLSRSTVYRVLVRHQLIQPVPRRRRRDQYIRWEHPMPMQLWQLDVTASLFLASGRECKVITGIDDHSRYCVIATVVARATGRAVCSAFVEAMRDYGVPDEVLSDNGKQFTGRFGKPRPAEVLFERICRENGITQRLTKPRSPTTTGKIERLHQTLQLELLNIHEPFESIEDAQAAVDAWRKECNADRPHQSLAMTFPAARFAPATGQSLGLHVPASLARPGSADPGAVPAGAPPLPPPSGGITEIERTVNASGNISVGNHVIGAGSPLAGQRVTVRLDGPVAHIIANGTTVRTLAGPAPPPARHRLRGARAGTAGPPQLPAPLTVRRRVSSRGAIMIGGQHIQVGLPHAGKTAEIIVGSDTYQITVEDGISIAAPRTTSHDIKRHKASNYDTRRADP